MRVVGLCGSGIEFVAREKTVRNLAIKRAFIIIPSFVLPQRSALKVMTHHTFVFEQQDECV